MKSGVEKDKAVGILVLVPTPIGNLGDITYRAVEVLSEADVICAEDTRRARILLNRYEIKQKPISYRDQNADQLAPQITEWIREGKKVCLISDAGSPGISDPGYRAVKAVIDAELPIEALPGATALIPALVLSGLAVDRFAFEGFLPVKKGRKARLEELAVEPRTIVLYEAPHRLIRTLGDLSDYLCGDRLAAVARELTKLHEEVVRCPLCQMQVHFAAHKPKGEMVVVVEGFRSYEKRIKTLKEDCP